MTQKHKKTLYRILLSALLFAVGLVLIAVWELTLPFRILAMLPAYLLIGYDVLIAAAGGIGRGQVFDENFLMSIASIGAFAVGEAPEAVAVMLFYQVGELFQRVAVGKSRQSISALLDLLPEQVNVLREGKTVQVCPEEIEVGETVLVRPGEKIPVDGTVTEGESSLDTASLTGESIPLDVKPGDDVCGGTINLQGVLQIRCTKPFDQSTASKIMELLENSEMHKAKTERFITRFAKYYTPIVVLTALALAVLPPLFLGIADFAVWSHWIHTALIFLIVSCPCALVISVPMAFFAGIGGASRRGILIKGAGHLEMLAKCDTVVLDKTGTLTKGSFCVTDVRSEAHSTEELLTLAALAEHHSNHPIAQSLKRAAAVTEAERRVTHTTEFAGGGVMAEIDGDTVLVGNAELLARHGVTAKAPDSRGGTCVHVAKNGSYLGYILISDTPKEDAASAMRALADGQIRTVLLTGDRRENAAALASELGIADVRAELLPQDKVSHFRAIKEQSRGAVAFVGDGINDAPVLAHADVGISMGKLGSDIAIEASDIVLMDDKPSSIAKAIALAKKTMRIVKQNIVLALGVKLGIMLLDLLVAASLVSVPGMALTWIAVFGDVGVAVLAILNSLRAMRS